MNDTGNTDHFKFTPLYIEYKFADYKRYCKHKYVGFEATVRKISFAVTVFWSQVHKTLKCDANQRAIILERCVSLLWLWQKHFHSVPSFVATRFTCVLLNKLLSACLRKWNYRLEKKGKTLPCQVTLNENNKYNFHVMKVLMMHERGIFLALLRVTAVLQRKPITWCEICYHHWINFVMVPPITNVEYRKRG